MLYMLECKYNIVLQLYVCKRIMTTEHTLVNNNFNSLSFNKQSYWKYLTCYYISNIQELQSLVMAITQVLYISSIWFPPYNGPKRAKTCSR